MGSRPSDTEIQRRIAALLQTPGAGRAVAGHLRDQSNAWAHRAAVSDLRARRVEALREASGMDRDLALRDVAECAGSHVH